MAEVEKRNKKTSREKRKPRKRLMRQQRPWSTSQKIADGDLMELSEDESKGPDDLKLLLRRFK